MAVAQIEQRVAALEAEVTRLKEKLEAVTKPARPWWQEIRNARSAFHKFNECSWLRLVARKEGV